MNLLIAIRPKQWIKTLLVAVPGIVSGEFLIWNLNTWKHLILSMVLYITLPSAVYLLNDIQDSSFDSRHLHKKKRPIAAGLISKSTALVSAISLLLVSWLVAESLDRIIMYLALAYLLLNIIYSAGMKRIKYWEMFFVASGYLVRVFSGAVLVSRFPSPEFFSIIFFGSLLIVIAKRLGEMRNLVESQRFVLRFYKRNILSSISIIISSLIIVEYCIFVFSTYFSHTLSYAALILYFSVIPFCIIMFELLDLVLNGKLEIPEIELIKNKFLVFTTCFWLFTIIIYTLLSK